MFLYILADLISFLEIQRLQLAGSSSTVLAVNLILYYLSLTWKGGGRMGVGGRLFEAGRERRPSRSFPVGLVAAFFSRLRGFRSPSNGLMVGSILI